jgi:hypothetical protein
VTNGSRWHGGREPIVAVRRSVRREPAEVAAMKVLAWLAVPLLIIAACMLVAGIGAPGLWIAVVAVGVALVVIGRGKPTTRTRH